MEFKSDKPIYIQIVDYVLEKILRQDWEIEERIPSVRELSTTLAVNPNTVMRAYEILERSSIIFNRRGIGFSVSAGAKEKISVMLKNDFINEELPYLFKKMKILGFSMKEIETEYNKFLKDEI
jgi:DNA-binding transcriptional regulator YhcF (GntR family)